MTIREFSQKHKVRFKRDEEGEEIIPARHGQIYLYSGHRLGVMFLMDSVGKWNNRRKECEAIGMETVQDGDCDGTCLFDPENKKQARLAIKLVGARQKRQLSAEQREAATERLRRFRESAPNPL